MRPPIWRPRKRYYSIVGEKIVTVMGLIFVLALVAFIVFAYGVIWP
jgi:hypothetical protein